MTYELKEILTRYELNAKKSLGQNFILDKNLLHRIAEVALSNFPDKNILEIGPGPGGLTQALLEQGATVYAIEKDERCVRALKELQEEYPKRLVILEGDALTFDEGAFLKEQDLQKIGIVSNLPYNISTVLLIKWLKKIHLFSGMTLMFQKEVADKLKAECSSHDYGRLSVVTQWLCLLEEKLVLRPEAFSPPPKVYSSVVLLKPLSHPFPCDFDSLDKITKETFNQRRKMLRNTLKKIVSVEEVEEELGLLTKIRPQDVSVEDFCKLALFVKNKREE
ncbi:MAG: 16S rRNA (adenine(1518)-N(6)/adenine(1519)-N(6))-dimethyltransferase RsmA [Alphaproteobacteria bacterium]|nr:16S rRNA (adenine(1518)-N(6)/adenine(1519)-N(6))-dimethyltransferase RsmA [Alphaproteobacteria bacterium]